MNGRWNILPCWPASVWTKHNLVDNVIFSPRVNALWKPSDRLQGRLTWSTGFRAPQAYDEDLHVAAVGGEAMLIKLADGLKTGEIQQLQRFD